VRRLVRTNVLFWDDLGQMHVTGAASEMLMEYRLVHRAIWYLAPEGLQNASCRLQSNVSSYNGSKNLGSN
jgi:hypothetical protein